MRIIYAVSACSDGVYQKLYEGSQRKPSIQAQKYHRLLIEGLGTITRVDVVSNPPVNREAMKKPWMWIPNETFGNVVYHNTPAIRSPLLKQKLPWKLEFLLERVELLLV